MFEPRATEEAAALLATAVDALRSDVIVRLTNDKLRTDEPSSAPPLPRDAIRTARRGQTMIIDVAVGNADPKHAVQQCNLLIMAYYEERRRQQVSGIEERQRVVGRALEQQPGDVALRRQFDELARVARVAEVDVRPLDTCAVSPN